ncbi:MAG: ankyrin repeat domain-containing protein [Pseudomonadota bacterium]
MTKTQDPLLSVASFSRQIPQEILEGNIKAFLSSGNDINSQNWQGNTMLHLAALNQNEHVVDYLLNQKNVDDTITNNNGHTFVAILSVNRLIEYKKYEQLSGKVKAIQPRNKLDSGSMHRDDEKENVSR